MCIRDSCNWRDNGASLYVALPGRTCNSAVKAVWGQFGCYPECVYPGLSVEEEAHRDCLSPGSWGCCSRYYRTVSRERRRQSRWYLDEGVDLFGIPQACQERFLVNADLTQWLLIVATSSRNVYILWIRIILRNHSVNDSLTQTHNPNSVDQIVDPLHCYIVVHCCDGHGEEVNHSRGDIPEVHLAGVRTEGMSASSRGHWHNGASPATSVERSIWNAAT